MVSAMRCDGRGGMNQGRKAEVRSAGMALIAGTHRCHGNWEERSAAQYRSRPTIED